MPATKLTILTSVKTSANPTLLDSLPLARPLVNLLSAYWTSPLVFSVFSPLRSADSSDTRDFAASSLVFSSLLPSGL